MKRWLLLLLCSAALCQAEEPRRSGFETMSPALQAMQRDDASNPAMLWVQGGRDLWAARCASCHAEKVLKGLAARYPAWDAASARPFTLAQRIQAHARLSEDDLLSVTAYLGLQSRGMPIAPPSDQRLDAFAEQGRKLFERRMGQLNLSCAQCHDEHAGQSLGGSAIPQGHPTGYPLYRLEWQTLGSLERRLRNCVAGVRAAPLTQEELTDLELYLMRRAQGMAVDAPAVRP